ncbi:MATE family efflux transporter [Tissierella sp. MB52-C2]|uniref:MATE family efflux transporter n=1 Tax=Tissierella sp. MB52-C2 TaxID=3070999 RepID=UPI00280ADF61|nr:MATE family efflux transporter [Tissierella sp. MB52-C2]WMM23992.1 MATE family efflux transporter [Tissierella sp. MB52-C2]
MNIKTKKYLIDTFKVAIPSIIEHVANVIVGFADTIMVATLGTVATAAVGINSTITWLVMAFSTLFAVGTTVQVAQSIGANNYKRAERAAINGLSSGLILFSSLFILLFTLSGYIPKFLGADVEILQGAVTYLRIWTLAIIPMLLGRVASSILRGIGNTKIPMVVAFFVNILNIIGNFFLIYKTRLINIPLTNINIKIWGAGLGVTGAAISTSLSNALGGFIMIYLLFNGSQVIKLELKDLFKFEKVLQKHIFKTGAPATGQDLVTNFGQVLYQKMVASLGTIQIAAHHLATTAESISYMPASGFSVAATTLVAQSLGAGKKEDAEGLGRVCFLLSLLAGTFSGIMLYVFPRQLMSLFSGDLAVIEEGIGALRIIAFIQPVFSATIVLTGVLRGAGDTKIPLYAAIGGMWFVRLISAYIFINIFHLGLKGAWLGMLMDLGSRFLIVFYRYNKKDWLNAEVVVDD